MLSFQDRPGLYLPKQHVCGASWANLSRETKHVPFLRTPSLFILSLSLAGFRCRIWKQTFQTEISKIQSIKRFSEDNAACTKMFGSSRWFAFKYKISLSGKNKQTTTPVQKCKPTTVPSLIYTKQIMEVMIWSRLEDLIYFLDEI